jgi:glycerol-3-phosphate dehydrogenase (NAD(P)+)
MKKATVFGAGSFGTAVATVLTSNFDEVVLWGRDAEQMATLQATRQNADYLPGLELPRNLTGTADLEAAARDTELVVVGIPSQATRDFLKRAQHLFPRGVPVISVAKGIENETLLTMTEVLEQCLDASFHDAIGVLSGPSFAKEMVQRMPTVVTIASRSEATAKVAQKMFQSDAFRTYTSTDVIGVQVGGSLKNVIAIAAGMGDGLGLGHNARAGIITRGLAEITRIAVKMGGNPLTLSGLAGMGDLVLTCTGELSRNRTVGMALGKGRSLDDILGEMNQVAEGVKTAKSAHALAKKWQVELPICEAVYRIAYEGKSARSAALELMGRSAKPELV